MIKSKNKNLGNLETQIFKEDLKKVGLEFKKCLKNTAKIIIYPTLGINFALPTMVSKAVKYDPDDSPHNMGIISIGFVLENVISYAILSKKAPELIPYVVGTQLVTNIGSGVYEYIKSIKSRTIEQKKNFFKKSLKEL